MLLRNSANTGFDAQEYYTTGAYPNYVYVADFNNDGRQDIVTVNYGSNSVSVLMRNASNTGFNEKVDYLVGIAPQYLTVGDFNGDGKMDLATSNINSNTISLLYRNTENTGFEDKIDYSTGHQPYSIGRGDFNGDGKLDLAVANWGDSSVSIFLRNPTNTGFDAKSDLALVGISYPTISVADFNNDGKDDLALTYYGRTTVSVFLRNILNTGFDTQIDYEIGAGNRMICATDFNNDGKTDLAVTNYDSGRTVSVLMNNFNISPKISTTTITSFTEQTPAVITNSIVINDIDGDTDWNGGKLQVQISTNSSANDYLLLATTNTGGIWLDATTNALMSNSTAIGSANAALVSDGAVWTFSFNSAASNALVQSTARAIQFNNTSDAPSTAFRTVTFTVTDKNTALNSATQTINITPVNDAPTLTAFAAAVSSGNVNSEITVDFAQLQAQGNEADVDGTVNRFVIKAVSSGSLKIGTSAATATAWNATNNTVDATRKAYWTPATDTKGNLNAFTVVAKDNGGLESLTAIQVKANVIVPNSAPVLATPSAINFTDTVFDDKFTTVNKFLVATDVDGNTLTYGIVGGTDNANGTVSKASAYGVLTVTKATGAYRFVANDAAIEALKTNAKVSFTVNVSDSHLVGNTVLVINLSQSGVTESNGNDTLTGTAANNQFDGLAGNDLINGLAGADIMRGGLGNDTYVVDNKGDQVIETSALATEMDTVNSAINYTLTANVENLNLTGVTAINGTGNAIANTLTGNIANNIINGGLGGDTLKGGAGDDVYVVDSISDKVIENAKEGTDTVQSSITWKLGAQLENLTLTGSAAINGTGNSFANVLTGNSKANSLQGLGGNDTYVVGSGDTVIENIGEGIDTVLSSVSHTLSANVENLTLTGSAVINATGNGLANILIGNAANNALNGGVGADVLKGGLGDDVYVVDNVGDTVTENLNEGVDRVNASVTYALSANVENLTLIGKANINATGNNSTNKLIGNIGNNTLDGGAGVDTLDGGLGRDTLIGGAGADTLTGGADADTFVFNTLTGGSDKVLDFQTGVDKIRCLDNAAGFVIGNGNHVIEKAIQITSGSSFTSTAELVVVTSNIVGTITATKAATTIGSASSAYALNDTRLFVVDNGTDSAVYMFKSAGADSLVSSTELSLVGLLQATPQTALADFMFA